MKLKKRYKALLIIAISLVGASLLWIGLKQFYEYSMEQELYYYDEFSLDGEELNIKFYRERRTCCPHSENLEPILNAKEARTQACVFWHTEETSKIKIHVLFDKERDTWFIFDDNGDRSTKTTRHLLVKSSGEIVAHW